MNFSLKLQYSITAIIVLRDLNADYLLEIVLVLTNTDYKRFTIDTLHILQDTDMYNLV